MADRKERVVLQKLQGHQEESKDMIDERAMEILDPEHREHYDSIETVNEACRIGIQAILDRSELRKTVSILKRDFNCSALRIGRQREENQKLLKRYTDLLQSRDACKSKEHKLRIENTALKKELEATQKLLAENTGCNGADRITTFCGHSLEEAIKIVTDFDRNEA